MERASEGLKLEMQLLCKLGNAYCAPLSVHANTYQSFKSPNNMQCVSVCSWNFTPSPGWTKEEAQILKLCLMKYGVGRWVQILDTGLLPGKLIQQLNGQTQRLIGQQSLAGMASCLVSSAQSSLSKEGRGNHCLPLLAAYTGLQVDIDRIRLDNAERTDVERKSGLIIWSGRKLMLD